MEYDIEISPAEITKIESNEEFLDEMAEIAGKLYWELYSVAKKYDCWPRAVAKIFVEKFDEAAKIMELGRLLEEGEKNG